MAALALIVIVAGGLVLALRRRIRGCRASVLARGLLAPPARAWLDAMCAEYAAIDDSRERRRFARGCVIAMAVGPVPADRTGELIQRVSGLAITAAAALAAFGLVRYPGLRSGLWLLYVAGFATALCLYALLGRRIALLGGSPARRVGLLLAVPAAGLAALAAWLSGPFSVTPVLLLPVLPAIAGGIAARRDGGTGSGVAAAFTCALFAGLLAFVGFVTLSYWTDGGSATPALLAEFHQSAMRDYATWAIGENLGGAVFILGFVPVLGIALGLTAASLAGPLPPESRREQNGLGPP